uniref:Late nodulin domain-containing protein n=1 Tax=Medicago truncatula TaxID=3880 RepID=I3SIL0_MEDTR|nr:unknown [Medicago truncatula]
MSQVVMFVYTLIIFLFPSHVITNKIAIYCVSDDDCLKTFTPLDLKCVDNVCEFNLRCKGKCGERDEKFVFLKALKKMDQKLVLEEQGNAREVKIPKKLLFDRIQVPTPATKDQVEEDDYDDDDEEEEEEEDDVDMWFHLPDVVCL